MIHSRMSTLVVGPIVLKYGRAVPFIVGAKREMWKGKGRIENYLSTRFHTSTFPMNDFIFPCNDLATQLVEAGAIVADDYKTHSFTLTTIKWLKVSLISQSCEV